MVKDGKDMMSSLMMPYRHVITEAYHPQSGRSLLPIKVLSVSSMLLRLDISERVNKRRNSCKKLCNVIANR